MKILDGLTMPPFFTLPCRMHGREAPCRSSERPWPRFLAIALACALFSIAGRAAPDVQKGQTAPAQEAAAKRQTVKAIYIPLADHYAGVVAYEKYRGAMVRADYQIETIPGPELVRARFREADVDMAFNVCPMVIDMFAEEPDFRWISLIHRDGNALAINEVLGKHVHLSDNRLDRKPDEAVAAAFGRLKRENGDPVQCAIPSPLATHTTVLYKYLKDHGKTLGFGVDQNTDLLAVVVKPPQSPAFLKRKNSRALPAAFEQSLPWADIIETEGDGRVAWYSKDVMAWPNGHVECVIIAKDAAIAHKREAVQEVVHYIHKAGQDIERARETGGAAMDAIVAMIREHMPAHTSDAIRESLRTDLVVINYHNLNVDENAKAGLRQIMDLAVEGGMLKQEVDIEALADSSFATEITKH